MNNSNSQSLTNEDLLERIEQLKYESRFGYISNSYFRYVIEREPNSRPRLLIYGDFDGIGKANEKYGFKKTTQFMQDTLNKLKNYLTTYYKKDVTCVSLGGDEFLFIIDDIDKQDLSDTLLKDIELDVFKHCKLSMSLGFSHTTENSSKNTNPLKSTLQQAQQMAEINKQEKSNSENQDLKDKFLLTITSYLNAIPVKNISEQEKNNILNKILDIFQNGFPTYFSLETNSALNLYSTVEENDLPDLPTDWKTESEQLQETLNNLGTNPITSGIRKSAIPGIIPKHKNEKFYCSYIDISNLKLSNLLCGHEKTDNNVKKLINKIRSIFAEEGINIATFDYSTNPNFIVNLNGCKFMILVSKDNPNLSFEKLNTILNKVQDECSKNILGITYSVSKAPLRLTSIKKFDKKTSSLEKHCEHKKAKYRQNRYIAPHIPKLWLKKLVLQIANDYQNARYKSFNFTRIFKPALQSAFNALPSARNIENNFLNQDYLNPTQNRYEKKDFRKTLSSYHVNDEINTLYMPQNVSDSLDKKNQMSSKSK